MNDILTLFFSSRNPKVILKQYILVHGDKSKNSFPPLHVLVSIFGTQV
jgi:hypothetical protein